MVFKRTTGVYELNYRFKFQMIKKEKKYVNSKWILRNLYVGVLIKVISALKTGLVF